MQNSHLKSDIVLTAQNKLHDRCLGKSNLTVSWSIKHWLWANVISSSISELFALLISFKHLFHHKFPAALLMVDKVTVKIRIR